MFKKLKDFKKSINEETKTKISIVFLFVFMIVVVVFLVLSKQSKSEGNTELNVDIKTNANFKYKIELDDKEYFLKGFFYGEKSVFTLETEDDINRYMIYYNEVYKHVDGKYIRTNKFIDNFDLKFLNLQYIAELIQTSEQKEGEFIFTYKERDIVIEVTDEIIILTKDNLVIKYELFNLGEVTDKSVNINHDDFLEE